MLVDRIMVIHVELHLGDDAAEIGNEAAEHAGLVHPPEHRLGIARAGQHVEEQGIGARIGAHLIVDQLGVAAGGAHRQRVDLQAMGVGEREHLDQPHRILGQEILVGDCEPAAVEHEAVELAGAAPEGGQAHAPSAPRELLVEMGEEHAGKVPDHLRVQEIMAHEALDRARRPGGPHNSSAPRSRADSRR